MEPFDVRADVPDADPTLRYTLGFERGFAMCLEKQATIQNLALAALAARFRQVAALLTIAAAPGVVDGVLHPPGVSINPNPYRRGVDEGERLCEWTLTVSPVMVARCRSAVKPSPGTSCAATEVAGAYGAAAAAANRYGGIRFDCFPCSLAWVKGKPYLPPANGGRPWTLEQIMPVLAAEPGAKAPQGPALPCWRQKAQQKGIPGSMTPDAIETEMRLAEDGAKGLVFFIDPLTGDIGHVFAVKTIGKGRNATVEFWDDQQQMDGRLWFADRRWTGWFLTFFRVQ